MSPPQFTSTTRKLEDLPSDGGQAVDTLVGAALRLFIRANETEAALARLTRRVAALKGRTAAHDEPASAKPNGERLARGERSDVGSFAKHY